MTHLARFPHPLRSCLLGAAVAAILFAVVPSPSGAADKAQTPRPETRRERDRRMQWWREARFGMFIHWGVYSVPAGTYNGQRVPGIGEWIQASAGIPREEYEKFPPQFNPVRFDAGEWARTMKEAGMKYVVITSKHHDGFAMFDSKVSDWDIVDRTPFKRDVLKELSRACRAEGIRFCTYHSILDWHHPSQERNPSARSVNDGYARNRMLEGRKAEYVTYMKGQLKEILDNYDPAVLWFDGEWVDWWTEADAKDLYQWLRRLKPDLVINNRIGKGRKGMEGLSKDESYAGDFGTPEQQVPPTGLAGVDWESCMTMNDTWGYKSYDSNWKSSAQLIRTLVDIASKGGNFLLNVGPTSEGIIPQPSVERLRDMGIWLRVNGESIYGTHASPFPKQLPWGRATSGSGRLYLHVFDWPKDRKLALMGVDGKARKAYLLADRSKTGLRFVQSGQDVVIDLPAAAPDPVDTVVTLEVR